MHLCYIIMINVILTTTHVTFYLYISVGFFYYLYCFRFLLLLVSFSISIGFFYYLCCFCFLFLLVYFVYFCWFSFCVYLCVLLLQMCWFCRDVGEDRPRRVSSAVPRGRKSTSITARLSGRIYTNFLSKYS